MAKFSSPSPETRQRAVLLVIALALAAATWWLLRQWIGGEQAKLERERARLMANYQAPIQVVAAAKDLPTGTVLEMAHFAPAKIPEKFVQPYAVRNPKDLVGKVTIAPMAEGEQVLLNKVRSANEVSAEATLSGVLQQGKRAVTIAVESVTGVGGFVRPGDAVDVLWTLSLNGAGAQPQVVTWVLFQDTPVLAVGHEMLGRATKTEETSSQYNVTLALTPQDPSFLLFAREQGRIQLSLRPKTEEGGAKVTIAPANVNTLMEQVLGVPPPPPPPLTKQVEVYKGLQKDVVTVVAQQDGQP